MRRWRNEYGTAIETQRVCRVRTVACRRVCPGAEHQHRIVLSLDAGRATRGGYGRCSGRETCLVDNEVYNLITIISSKLEGIVAYQQFERDGQANDPIWRELRQQHEQAVRRLMQQLEQFAQQGKLRSR